MMRGPAQGTQVLPGGVDLLVFDFDGVMTDNRVLVMEDGREAVFCNRADGLAFDMLRQAGVPALILSTERNLVVAARGGKLCVPVLQGVRDKVAALRNYCRKRGIRLSRTLFVGNDLNDLAVLRTVGMSVCPADAHADVRAVCTLTLKSRGGAGVVRELVEQVLGIPFSGAGRTSRTSDRRAAATQPTDASTAQAAPPRKPGRSRQR